MISEKSIKNLKIFNSLQKIPNHKTKLFKFFCFENSEGQEILNIWFSLNTKLWQNRRKKNLKFKKSKKIFIQENQTKLNFEFQKSRSAVSKFIDMSLKRVLYFSDIEFSCPDWKKNYIYKHVIGVAYNLGLCQFPSIDLNIKCNSKRGRRKQANMALVTKKSTGPTNPALQSINLEHQISTVDEQQHDNQMEPISQLSKQENNVINRLLIFII
ncbi:hypothetical protein BpHYR1_015049 [Brachionus plicatilis]|uniref:Uncharacterized protein n=1 Tax=Brachionus plicatilis TaxID=10195 RepID=A0A3M7QL91_BRAPC|nr:hypothetical protein BpHYR1_015049 [Brachionus plicatilis]